MGQVWLNLEPSRIRKDCLDLQWRVGYYPRGVAIPFIQAGRVSACMN